MISVKSDCIVCGKRGREIIRNNLPMFMCDSCGLFWRASFDLPENHYEIRGFELDNGKKIDARYANSLGRIETLRKYADLNNVCDIGCGEGVFLKALSDFGYKNVVGLEPSRAARDFALGNKLRIIEGDMENFDASFFSENGIHTVTMFHVIEHLKDPGMMLKIIFDNLGKGDKLVIETPDSASSILRKSNYKHELIYPEHLYYFNKVNLKKLLEKSGFTVIASGNRDFNEKNLSMKESLSRLGLVKIREEVKKTDSNSDSRVINFSVDVNGICRRIMRRLLSKIVSFVGQGNYLWIVAEK